MKVFDCRWHKTQTKILYYPITMLLSVAIFVTSASATPQQLAVQIRQMSTNPVLTRSIVNYKVEVKNTGAGPQGNVQVKVRLPGSLWGLPANGVGASCTFAGGGGSPAALVSCTAGTFAGGATKFFDVQVIAPSRVVYDSSQQFTITAGMDVNGPLEGTGGADAIATVATDVLAPPDLDPEWSGPLTITAGREAAYMLRVGNSGDGRAGGVFARITLLREVDFVRLEQSTLCSCPRTGQEINCSELLWGGACA